MSSTDNTLYDKIYNLKYDISPEPTREREETPPPPYEEEEEDYIPPEPTQKREREETPPPPYDYEDDTLPPYEEPEPKRLPPPVWRTEYLQHEKSVLSKLKEDGWVSYKEYKNITNRMAYGIPFRKRRQK